MGLATITGALKEQDEKPGRYNYLQASPKGKGGGSLPATSPVVRVSSEASLKGQCSSLEPQDGSLTSAQWLFVEPGLSGWKAMRKRESQPWQRCVSTQLCEILSIE